MLLIVLIIVIIVIGLCGLIVLTVVLLIVVIVLVVVIVVEVFAVLFSLLSLICFLLVLLTSLVGRNLEFCLQCVKLFLKFLLKSLCCSLLFCKLCLKSSYFLIGKLIVIIVIILLASILKIILDIVDCFTKLEQFLVLLLKSLNCILVVALKICRYLISVLICLKKLKKLFNCKVEKLLVGKLGVSVKNSCNYLCVTGSNVPLLSGCEVRIKNLFRNLTCDTLLLKELHKLVGKALFNLFYNLCVLAVNVNVNGILILCGIHITKINCGFGKINNCVLCGLALKLNCGKNNLAVGVNCVSGNNRTGFVCNHFNFGIDSQSDVSECSVSGTAFFC